MGLSCQSKVFTLHTSSEKDRWRHPRRRRRRRRRRRQGRRRQKTRSVRKTRKRRGRRIHYGDKIDLKDGLAAVRKFHRPLKTWQVSEQRRSRNLARNVRHLKAGQHEGGGSVRLVIYDNRQNSNLGFLK